MHTDIGSVCEWLIELHYIPLAHVWSQKREPIIPSWMSPRSTKFLHRRS